MRIVGLLLIGACNGAPDELPLVVTERTDCDPLDSSVCALPFPSSHFLADDDTTVTGYRVSFGPETLPMNRDGHQITPEYWNEKDGFSTNAQPQAWFRDLSTTGLISWTDYAAYAADSATTVIIDTSTGERVPHFAELDVTVDAPGDASLMLRPAQPLDHDRRYIVGIRNLVTTSGDPVAVSDAFEALRDGTETSDGDVEYRRDHFDTDVFPLLEATGFSRSELQLAWDFHTVSQDSSVGRMLWMRDDALDSWGDDGPAYVVDSVEDGDCSNESVSIGRTIYATITVPLYTELDEPASFLTRDADDMPYRNGTAEATVMVRVPCSVIENPGPSPILQYGHGLLGHYGEARSGYLSDMIDDFGWVLIAMEWTGMAEDDIDDIVWMSVDDPSQFAFLPERSMQGFVEKMGGLAAIQGAMGQDDSLVFDGTSVVDPDVAYYYGNSQGGILGGAYLILSPEIERGVLGVGGLPYAMLLGRSIDFDPYFLLFKAKFIDGRKITLLINNLMQMLWDVGEGGGYIDALNPPLPGNPDKTVLIQVAHGDRQVSTLGAWNQARAFGAKAIAPHQEIFGVETVTAPHTGSAYVEWYYPDGAELPEEGLPPEGPDPHECVRREAKAQQQLFDFLTTGVVNNYCDGTCVGSVAETCPSD
jgi:hypothetical protein